jgi:hypothetical protein
MVTDIVNVIVDERAQGSIQEHTLVTRFAGFSKFQWSRELADAFCWALEE